MCMCVSQIFSVYSFGDGHLGCCSILAVVNNVAVSMEMYISLRIFISSDEYSGIGLLDHMVVVFFTHPLFFIVAVIYIPTNSMEGFLFSTSLPTLFLLLIIVILTDVR